MIKHLAAIAVAAVFSTAASAATFTPIEFDKNKEYLPHGAPYELTPTLGDGVTGNQGTGIPFDLTSEPGYDIWHSDVGDATGTKTLDIATNLFGVDKIYTLMNTFWGSAIPGLTQISFFGTNGLTQTFSLTGGVEIRDYVSTSFSNSTSSPITTPWHVNDNSYGTTSRLDMQTFDLNDAFLSETLTGIRLTDSGERFMHRAFLVGVTAETPAVPLPAAGLLLVGAIGMLGVKRRSKPSRAA